MPQIDTLANLAVIFGAIVSTATLILVGIDYYLNHLRVKRSQVEISPSNKENKVSGKPAKFDFDFPVILTNHGKRHGKFGEGDVNRMILGFDDCGEYVDIDEESRYYVRALNLSEHNIPPEWNETATLNAEFREHESIGRKLDSANWVYLSLNFLVTDNEGAYKVNFSGKVDVSDFVVSD